MRVKNLTVEDVRAIVRQVSIIAYDGNVVLESVRQESANFTAFKIGTLDSRDKGSRRSASGRHGRWACTHVFEDVMAQLIENGGQLHIPGRSPGNPGRGQRIVATLDELESWADDYNCGNMGTAAVPVFPESLCVDCDMS